MSNTILDKVVIDLDYIHGQLFNVSELPNKQNKNHWLDKGDWIRTAAHAGVEKIFFVENNPIVVFAQCGHSSHEEIEAYNKIWCLSSPRILFLATDGELSVIDLAQAPIRITKNEAERELNTLKRLQFTQNILEELKDFHRENVESGRIFQDERFGNIRNRADQALIADLRIVRRNLINDDLPIPYVHSLIGRSIFIRYLEDRGILTDKYFLKVAGENQAWKNLVIYPAPEEEIDFSNVHSKYSRILQNKDFTYALFKRLSYDFNGDMFPDVDTEERKVKFKHLKILRGMLYGNTEPLLFFFSYKFDIIPLALISAIYEEFYQSLVLKTDIDKKKSIYRQEGAFYTPPALVEFVLSRILNKDIIKQSPRILDPSCGSGIFLVEAFRRIVRYHFSEGKPLSFDGLKEIMKKQLIGIEINHEAARITAFSLYLALLNYLEPPSILEHIKNGEKLPNLIVSDKKTANHLNIIYSDNAFKFDKKTIGNVDVVIGNPPWGAAGKNIDETTKEQIKVMLSWCNRHGYDIGDKDPSQAFLLFARDILSENGRCGMLVSAATLLSLGPKFVSFRQELMKSICLTEVFNFAHIRKFFFKDAISPFFILYFQLKKQNKYPVKYWSPKQIKSIENTQSIFLSKYDRVLIINQDLTDNKTWKINWFGRHPDSIFISHLNEFHTLLSIVDRENSGQGYVKNPAKYDFQEVEKLPSLILSSFGKYSKLEKVKQKTPVKYYRSGKIAAYHGPRLLIKKGISSKVQDNIIVRYTTDSFCFTNSINGIKLVNNDEHLYLLILGILWSSFSKYFYFNISAHWGIWHDEIYLDDELLQLPIPEELTGKTVNRIVDLVKQMREYSPDIKDLLHQDGISEEKIKKQRRKWEKELDIAVFDLYNFTERQRNLIEDCCNITIPFFYDSYTSIGNKPVIENGNTEWIKNYAVRFAESWKLYLNYGDVLRADICVALFNNIMAVEFYIADSNDDWDLSPKEKIWGHILSQIGDTLSHPLGTSQILLDGIIHIITDDSIIIIKRNEKRFWTKSLAYEDAESTITKRILETSTETRSSK